MARKRVAMLEGDNVRTRHARRKVNGKRQDLLIKQGISKLFVVADGEELEVAWMLGDGADEYFLVMSSDTDIVAKAFTGILKDRGWRLLKE